MIKTLVSISIIVSIIGIALTFGDLFSILLQVKGSFIYYISFIFSRLAIFSIMFELMFEIITGIIKKL